MTKAELTKTLRITDQETARVVAILDTRGAIVGAGCLVSRTHVLTCAHVVLSALGISEAKSKQAKGKPLKLKVVGLGAQKVVGAIVQEIGSANEAHQDLALLTLRPELKVAMTPTVFATPLRHSGKRFSVLGFPDGYDQGRHASGVLHAADAVGLVQMDAAGALTVKGGYSGAPVWCADVSAFVGIVVTERFGARVSWCIPSRILCQFFPHLPVRFRVPPVDRPTINDWDDDDPNIEIFGTTSNNGERRLTATVKEKKNYYVVRATYKTLKGARPARGDYVTFITYPDFKKETQDAYELFAQIGRGTSATVEFYPIDGFTVAAIGDAGDTALTLDLSELMN